MGWTEGHSGFSQITDKLYWAVAFEMSKKNFQKSTASIGEAGQEEPSF